MSILSSLLGITKSQPAQVIPASITEPKIAEEIAPFLKDILGKGQALYKQRMEEGFVPFEGQTLADVTAQQKAAQEGIEGLVGTQAPAFEEARGLVRGIAEKPTTEALEEFMSPYQQAVVDIEKRKAQETFERDILPKVRAAQIGAGAFGGTRGTMLEAQTLGEQAELLADIQARGQQQAFQDARQAFAQQKAREAQAAEGLTGLATGQFGAQTRELGALEAVGREEQQRQQQLLDESYQRFLQERGFPEQQLGQYQALVAGTPISQGNITYQQAKFQPSPLSQALGTAATALGTYQGAKNLKLFGSKEGGGIKEGIASLPVVQKQRGNQILQQTMQDVSPISGVSDVGTDEEAGAILDFLRSLGTNIKDYIKNPTTERQKERAKELQDFNVKAREIAKEKEDAEKIRQQNLMLQNQQNQLEKSILDAANQTTVNRQPTVTNQPVVNTNQQPAFNTNQQQTTDTDVDDTTQTTAQNRSSNVLSGVNNVTEPLPEEKPDPRPLDEMRTAVRGIEGLLKDREAKLTAQEAREKELLDKDREMVRGAAKAKFLTDLGAALLKGDGTGGGFFSEFGKAGAEAVKGSQKAVDALRNLNKEERKIVTDSANRQFQNELSQYQQQLKLGEITLQEYKLGIEQTKANLLNFLKQIEIGDSAETSVATLFTNTRAGTVPLDIALEAYKEKRNRLPKNIQKVYDNNFNELIEAEPEAGLNKFSLQPKR